MLPVRMKKPKCSIEDGKILEALGSQMDITLLSLAAIAALKIAMSVC